MGYVGFSVLQHKDNKKAATLCTTHDVTAASSMTTFSSSNPLPIKNGINIFVYQLVSL